MSKKLEYLFRFVFDTNFPVLLFLFFLSMLLLNCEYWNKTNRKSFILLTLVNVAERFRLYWKVGSACTCRRNHMSMLFRAMCDIWSMHQNDSIRIMCLSQYSFCFWREISTGSFYKNGIKWCFIISNVQLIRCCHKHGLVRIIAAPQNALGHGDPLHLWSDNAV